MNSLKQHEIRCKENPQRVVQKMSKENAERLSILYRERAEDKRTKDEEEYNLEPFYCKQCNDKLSFAKRKNTFCSISCAQKVNNLKRDRSLYIRDESVCKKISISNKLFFEKKRISDQLKCFEEHVFSKLFWNYCSNCNRLNLDRKYKKICFSCKCSFGQKAAYLSGSQRVGGGRTKWLSYKDIKVQGTYELRMCYILDKMLELDLIMGWEYTNDRIPYVTIDGKKSTYLLDFKVFKNDNIFYYIETKGYKIENDDFKWKTVAMSGLKLLIYFEKDIEELEKLYF